MLIRPETPADYPGITDVNRSAFGGDAEARLVVLLRDAGLVVASLVAVGDTGEVVGHIMFSAVGIITATTELRVASLAPMAVARSRQRQGIGSTLVERGLAACRDSGYRAAIVVGHPAFYPRFGFSPVLVESLTNPFAKGDAFMGVELARGALSDLGEGRVIYPAAFDQL